MLSEICQKKTNTVLNHLYVESYRAKLIETEYNGGHQGWERWGDVGQRVQTSSDEMNQFLGSQVQHGDYA